MSWRALAAVAGAGWLAACQPAPTASAPRAPSSLPPCTGSSSSGLDLRQLRLRADELALVDVVVAAHLVMISRGCTLMNCEALARPGEPVPSCNVCPAELALAASPRGHGEAMLYLKRPLPPGCLDLTRPDACGFAVRGQAVLAHGWLSPARGELALVDVTLCER